MFEKEAEEYRKDLKSNFFLSEPQLDLACQGFKDGAEFSYSKAKEEVKTIIQDLLSNSDEYARQRAMDFLKEE